MSATFSLRVGSSPMMLTLLSSAFAECNAASTYHPAQQNLQACTWGSALLAFHTQSEHSCKACICLKYNLTLRGKCTSKTSFTVIHMIDCHTQQAVQG